MIDYRSNINLFLGDCLEIMKNIPNNCVDLILCDLPYEMTDCVWDQSINLNHLWVHYLRISKKNAPVLLFGIEPFSSKLRLSNLENYKYDWIWHKTQPTGWLNAKKQPLRQYECISVFYKNQCFYNPQLTNKNVKNIRTGVDGPRPQVYGATVEQEKTRGIPKNKTYPRNVIQFANCNKGESGFHPTQKPVLLLEYLIKTYTNENDLVLDNAMGSGSTGVACVNLKRKFLGIEKNAQYFEIARNRINLVQNKD